MRNAARLMLGLILAATAVRVSAQDGSKTTTKAAASEKQRGILLEKLSWDEAEKVLTRDQVVVIAMGAGSKEHGLHLQLNNDFLMAEYLKERVLEKAAVVVAPTINYSYYPAFLEYPGSTSVGLETARNMVTEIVRSIAHYGPRKFYLINTGISTLRPLKQSAEELAKDGILMRYLDFTQEDPVETRLRKSGGTHADEIETAEMLYIAPETVRMEKARRDLNPDQPGGLTRDPKGKGTYSPTGAWGDPTLATREEGQELVEATVMRILREIEALRGTKVGP
jgi:creatinine amidohydrolase